MIYEKITGTRSYFIYNSFAALPYSAGAVDEDLLNIQAQERFWGEITQIDEDIQEI